MVTALREVEFMLLYISFQRAHAGTSESSEGAGSGEEKRKKKKKKEKKHKKQKSSETGSEVSNLS